MAKSAEADSSDGGRTCRSSEEERYIGARHRGVSVHRDLRTTAPVAWTGTTVVGAWMTASQHPSAKLPQTLDCLCNHFRNTNFTEQVVLFEFGLKPKKT